MVAKVRSPGASPVVTRNFPATNAGVLAPLPGDRQFRKSRVRPPLNRGPGGRISKRDPSHRFVVAAPTVMSPLIPEKGVQR
jgi:hypothetical protein